MIYHISIIILTSIFLCLVGDWVLLKLWKQRSYENKEYVTPNRVLVHSGNSTKQVFEASYPKPLLVSTFHVLCSFDIWDDRPKCLLVSTTFQVIWSICLFTKSYEAFAPFNISCRLLVRHMRWSAKVFARFNNIPSHPKSLLWSAFFAMGWIDFLI